MEFACELTTHFNRWWSASGANDFESLSELMVPEQFKNSVPVRVAMYLNEQKAKTIVVAAALADDYVLTHRAGFGEQRAGNRASVPSLADAESSVCRRSSQPSVAGSSSPPRPDRVL